MTALDRYDRLEAMGIWRQDFEDQGTEVVVKFGDATLVIIGENDRPIGHWSLPAIRTIRDDAQRSVYAVDGEAHENLVIEDRDMRDALHTIISRMVITETNTSSVQRPSVAWWFVGGFGFLVCIVLLLPTFMNSMAHRLISPERARVLAHEMLPLIEERTGPECITLPGRRALEKVASVLDHGQAFDIRIMDLGDVPVVSLPSRTVVVNAAILREAASPEEFAGWAAVGLVGTDTSPALANLFDNGGTYDGIKFILTGDLPVSAMNRSINRILITSGGLDAQTEQRVADVMSGAGIPGQPIIDGLGREGIASTLTPWEVLASDADFLLDDNQWVALQSICES